MNRTTRLKKPQIPELDTLYQFDDLGGRTKYGGVEMSSTTDIPSFQEIMDETHSAVVAEATARDDADEALQAQIDGLSDDLTAESSARVSADNELQAEIDTIVASSDVKDIVGTYADLQNYDTSELGDNDIIKVLQDETHQDETTYYRWVLADEEFSLIGEEGPYYTKAATDALLDDKADKANTYTKTEVDGLIPPVVQTTGTSTTDVMSQDAATKMLFKDNRTGSVRIGSDADVNSLFGNVAIGSGAKATSYQCVAIGMNAKAEKENSVAIGFSSGSMTNKGASSVSIGVGANSNGDSSVAIRGVAGGENSVAIGFGSKTTEKGQFDIGAANVSGGGAGYANSDYRLLTGLYDGQSAHDAATKGQLDSVAIKNAGAPTSSTVGTVGQLLEDTTNGKLYICADATNPYVWEEVGGSQYNTYSTVTTSNSATGGAIYLGNLDATQTQKADPTTSDAHYKYFWALPYTNTSKPSSNSIVIGAEAGNNLSNSIALGFNTSITASSSVGIGAQYVRGSESTAIGSSSVADGPGSVVLGYGAKITNSNSFGSVALGYTSEATQRGEVNVGSRNTTYGYNNSNYRIISGVYDPQSAHDAATKGYVDGLVGNVAAALNAINNGGNA